MQHNVQVPSIFFQGNRFNPPTREQIKKIKSGEAVAPVLLTRFGALKKVIVADGFHRVCAAFRIDPDVVLHCKLVGP